MLRKPLALLAALFCFTLSFASKETLKQGWDNFNANKRTEAIQSFTAAAADADTKAEANLALALVYWSMDKEDESFKAFQNFFNASDNPYPYLYSLWSSDVIFEGYGKKKEEKVKFLKTLADDPKANGTLRAMAHFMLGKHYEAMGDFKKSADEFTQTGTLDNWQVLGTFDNISGSGFNKPFGAVGKPKDDAVFKNKVDAEVKWFTPPAVRRDHWFDFSYYFSISNSVMYAQTFLKSDKDQEVFFRSGNSGSFKIWVNDKLVLNIAEERNCDMDIYIHNVKLNKGYNRVLVQIGESETDAANFMIRVTDKDGNQVKGISSEAAYQDYGKAAEYTVVNQDLFAEDFFEAKTKAEPENLLNYVLLANVYLRNDKVYEARKALKKANELAPNSTFVGNRMIEAYARDKDVTDLTKEYEKIKSNDPDGPYALKGLMDEARDKENYDEQEKLLEKYKSLYGEDEYTEVVNLNLLGSRKKYDELIKEASRLYAKYPDNYDLMNLAYSIERNTSKDLNKANLILKAYLKNNYSDKVITALAGNYFDLGNKKEGFELYNQRVANFPYSVSYYTDLNDLYFEARDYQNALVWAKKALELVPYVGGYWSRIGKVNEALGDKEGAKDAYRKAIYYTPTNYDARKQLRKLENKKDMFENFEKVDAYDMFKKSPKSDEYPDDNSFVLLNETQRVVYPEGATEERSEVLVKVFNQNGIDNWKEYSIGYNRYRQRLIIDKAEVFKKDGSKVQAEKNEDYLVFTNLEVDDAIHVSYRIENYNTGKLAQHFWEQFNFNFDYPVKISRYSLILPATKHFDAKAMNSTLKTSKKEIEDGMVLYTWELSDQVAIKPEPFMPPLTDVGAILDISTLPDWKYVSNWYSDLSTTLAKSDFMIKETVAELFKDKKNLTELQKAKMIYEYIEANVSYSNVPFMHGPIIPQKASRTLSTKLGDCKDVATLFVAMCKEVGVKANLILVDTRDNGEKHLNLPSIDFNHCIAQLQAGGKTYYIELTDQKLSFTSIPITDLNSNILFIPRSDEDSAATKLSKINTKNRPMNNIIRETEVKFDNNDMTFNRRTIKTGMYASAVRNDYADVGKDKQEKAMTQAVASDFTSPVKLLSLNFPNLKTLSDTVVYDYSFNIKSQLTEVVGIKITRLPWSDAVRSLDFLALETRKYPFLVWNYTGVEVERETLLIEIPKGKTLAEIPKSVTLTCSAADYNLTYIVTTPGKLKAVREVKWKTDTVSSADYPAFRDFFNRVAEADSKQIGFK